MSKGLVFWRRDEDGEGLHLRFVISEPDVDGKVLVVHMTSFRGNGREDMSCILNPGDHECVTDKSYIRYDKAFDIELMNLLKEKMTGSIISKAELKAPVLKRIQEGAQKSAALQRKFKKYFDKF
jgi:hypothetical protein